MGTFLNLYRLKVKVFLGAFKASKVSLILLAVYLVGTTPGSIGMSIALANSVKEGADLTAYLDPFSAVISGLLALTLAMTLRGFTVFEYEQSMIFTSTITPRCFLIASLLADITAFSMFFFPLPLFLGITVASLGLSIISVLSIIAVLLLFFFFLIFSKTSFSILESVYPRSSIRIVTIFTVLLLLLPATNFLAPFPLEYNKLPYPSTLLAQAILHSLYDRPPSVQWFLGMASYFLASLMLFVFSSKKNLFLFAKPVPLVSPFDASPRVQTVKMGTNIRIFSRLTPSFSLSLRSESLLLFLMRKEFIRMLRDGSLFTVLLFYLIVSIVSAATSTGQAPFPGGLLILVIYSFVVPAMLVSNWRIGEMGNLWIPLTSALSFGFVVKSLLYDLTLVAFVVPAATIVVLGLFSLISPWIPLVLIASISLIGCPVNLFAAISFLGKKRKATPSFMIGWVSMLLFGLLVSPAYAYVMLSLLFGFSVEINLLLAVPVLAYSALIFWLFSKKSVEKASSIEIQA